MTEMTLENAKPMLSKKVTAIIWMLLGSLGVFILVMTMNSAIARPAAKAEKKTVAFQVQKSQQKNQRMKMQRRARPKPKSVNRAAQAPLPKISGALSGMSFGIPDFDASAVGGLSNNMLGNLDNLVMTEDVVDKPPKVRNRVDAVYPAKARQKDITGFVTLSLLVDDAGQVEKIKILDASPDGVFEDAAYDAVRNWRFEPATYKGKNVKVWVKQRVNFKLI